MSEQKKFANLGRQLRAIVAVTAWLITAFFLSQIIAGGVLYVVGLFAPGVLEANQNVFVVVLSSFIYVVLLGILLFLPRVIGRRMPTRTTLGIQRDLNWKDLGLSLPALVVYFVATTAALYLATSFLPWIDIDQAQETGIANVVSSGELVLVFALFVVIGPIVEELIFRGYLYGKIRATKVPFWLTALIVSVLFGIAHMQWNVGIDTFVLSMVMCIAREVTGAIWTGVAMHMLKNGIAYYFLFIAPGSLVSLGLLGL